MENLTTKLNFTATYPCDQSTADEIIELIAKQRNGTFYRSLEKTKQTETHQSFKFFNSVKKVATKYIISSFIYIDKQQLSLGYDVEKDTFYLIVYLKSEVTIPVSKEQARTNEIYFGEQNPNDDEDYAIKTSDRMEAEGNFDEADFWRQIENSEDNA